MIKNKLYESLGLLRRVSMLDIGIQRRYVNDFLCIKSNTVIAVRKFV